MSKRKPKKLAETAWAIRVTSDERSPTFLRDPICGGPEVFRTRAVARSANLEACFDGLGIVRLYLNE